MTANYYDMDGKLTKIKRTANGVSYWNDKGAYTEEYTKLYDELVPSSGEATTNRGEILRSISRLAYEYYNNGNGNAVECEYYEETSKCQNCNGSGYIEDLDDEGNVIEVECDECFGSGEVSEECEGDNHITEIWQYFLDNLYAVAKDPRVGKAFSDMLFDAVRNLEDFLLGTNHSLSAYAPKVMFSEHNESIYNRVIDYIMWYLLTFDEKNCTAVLEKSSNS